MKKIKIIGIILACFIVITGSHAFAQNTVEILLEGYVIPIEGRELIPGWDENNGGRYVASTVALVRGESATVVVDPGFAGNRKQLLDALDEADVELKDVTHVFISHHHPDHTLYAGLFPKATLVDFWATYKNDLWEDHPDNFEIADGIIVRRTPGHTNEDASLVVYTQHGTVVFTHVWWFRTEDGLLFPPIDPLADDQDALDASREDLLGIADCFVPGHGSPFPNPENPDATCVFGKGGDDDDDDDDDDDED